MADAGASFGVQTNWNIPVAVPTAAALPATAPTGAMIFAIDTGIVWTMVANSWALMSAAGLVGALGTPLGPATPAGLVKQVSVAAQELIFPDNLSVRGVSIGMRPASGRNGRNIHIRAQPTDIGFIGGGIYFHAGRGFDSNGLHFYETNADGSDILIMQLFAEGGGVPVMALFGSIGFKISDNTPGTNFQSTNYLQNIVNGNYNCTVNGVSRIKMGQVGIGFFGAAEAVKPTASGSWAGNAAGKSLATALASLGLIVDSTTT